MAPVTVLLTIAGLGVGGAETHVVSLARGLAENGYRPVLASGGGIYEGELAGCGIPHYRVDMDSYSPLALARAAAALRRVIARERAALVHAHGRIPALVSEAAAAAEKVRFLTTAHAVFAAPWHLKLLSRWGERTIAVSSDIKDHLVKNFGVPEERITVIPNGVDVERFCPVPPSPGLLEELGVSGGEPVVASVSRLEGVLAGVALSAVEACASLLPSFPRLVLLIAGGGRRAAEVAQAAAAANRSAGREFVKFLGPRTDVHRVMAAADLVVGVSRTALEAMACAKNVVLAGGEGFWGLVRPEHLGFLAEDNFTGRSTRRTVTAAALKDAVREFLDLTWGERRERGAVMRRFVEENFSSAAMAQRTARVYGELLAHGGGRRA